MAGPGWAGEVWLPSLRLPRHVRGSEEVWAFLGRSPAEVTLSKTSLHCLTFSLCCVENSHARQRGKVKRALRKQVNASQEVTGARDS